MFNFRFAHRSKNPLQQESPISPAKAGVHRRERYVFCSWAPALAWETGKVRWRDSEYTRDALIWRRRAQNAKNGAECDIKQGDFKGPVQKRMHPERALVDGEHVKMMDDQQRMQEKQRRGKPSTARHDEKGGGESNVYH